MSTLLLDAESNTTSDWLTRLHERKRFVPTLVGSNYQPLGTKWLARPINRELACRKRNNIVSIKSQMSSSILFIGGYSPARNAKFNDIHELLDGASEARLKRRRCEWSPRCDLHAHASRDGKVIFIIGGDDGRIRSDTWVSVDGGNTFLERSEEAPWGGRMQYSTCLFDKDTILLCGGISTESEYLSDMWISRDQGTTWALKAPSCPWGPRKGVCMISLHDGSILLVGGSSETRAFDDVWRSTDLGQSWTCVTPRAPWKSRQGLSMVQDPLSSEIVMFGGTDYYGHVLSDAWASVDSGVTWTPRPQLPSDHSSQVVPIVSDSGTLSIFTMGSTESSTKQFLSHSDLKFIQRDCVFLLMLGKRLEKQIPNEIWVGNVLPMTVDLRSLWGRKNTEWKKI